MRKILPAMFILALCVFALFKPPCFSKDEPTTVTPYFSPKGGAEKALIAELKKAKKSVKVCIYLFTSKRIAECLTETAKTCKVTVIMDKRMTEAAENSQYKFLVENDIDVKLFRFPKSGSPDQPEPSFHHKFAVIDDSTVITGSFNWSVYAETSNYEDMLIIKDNALALQYARRFDEILKESEK